MNDKGTPCTPPAYLRAVKVQARNRVAKEARKAIRLVVDNTVEGYGECKPSLPTVKPTTY